MSTPTAVQSPKDLLAIAWTSEVSVDASVAIEVPASRERDVPGECLLRRLFGERVRGRFNRTLQLCQSSVSIVDARPHDARPARTRKDADPRCAKLKCARAGTGAAHGIVQPINPLSLDAAQEPHREMKLVAAGPANGLRGQRGAQFVLRFLNRVPDGLWQRDRDEQPVPFRTRVGSRMAVHETSIVVDRCARGVVRIAGCPRG